MASPDYGDLISSVSIVLGVLTYFLSVVNEDTSKVVQEAVPPKGQVAARSDFRKKARNKLALQHIPVTLGLIFLFYLCLPSSIAVIASSHFEWWDFDPLPSLLVALELGVGGCLSFAVFLFVKMVSKWNKAR
jgi:hypothetical protein